MSIACHHFDAYGRCSCGRKWTDIRNTPESDIAAEHIAHVGTLTTTEWGSIAQARQAEDERIARAMGDLA